MMGNVVSFLINTFFFNLVREWTNEYFLGDTVVQNLPANAGDTGLIPGSGISLAVGNDNPLQYSCLENSMDGRARQATVHRITKSQTQLSMHTHTHTNQWSLKVNVSLFTDLFIIIVLPNFLKINRYAQLLIHQLCCVPNHIKEFAHILFCLLTDM